MAVIRFFSLGVLGLALVTWSVIGAETVDIAAKIRQQNPALIAEAFLGNEAEVKRLLAGGESPDQSNSAGQTALMMAASRGHSDITKALLERGADVNLADKDGTTVLMLAAQNGSAGIAALLLAKNAFVDASHQTGFTPLMYAATSDHEEVAKLLLDAGADIAKRDKKERTPLIIAAINNSYKVAKLLLDKGAKPDAKDKAGFSAKEYVELGRHVNMVKLFNGAATAPAASDDPAPAEQAATEEETARQVAYWTLHANAFRLAASHDLSKALQQWTCTTCSGVKKAWDDTFAVFQENAVPEQSIKLFFASSVFFVGQITHHQAVIAYYNPWVDSILLTEMNRSGTSAVLSPNVLFVSGECWRDEPATSSEDILKIFHIKEPLLLALARNYHGIETRFSQWYSPSTRGGVMVPELRKRYGSKNETLQPIIARMLYQGVSFKAFHAEKNQWQANVITSLANLLKGGNEKDIVAFLSPNQDKKMLTSICLLPELHRSHLGPVFYGQGGNATIIGLISPYVPSWVYAVQIRGESTPGATMVEAFDLVQSGKLIELYDGSK